jgi:hypothetical protein
MVQRVHFGEEVGFGRGRFALVGQPLLAVLWLGEGTAHSQEWLCHQNRKDSALQNLAVALHTEGG